MQSLLTGLLSGIVVVTALGLAVFWATRRAAIASPRLLRLGWIARILGAMAFLGLELAGVYAMGGLYRYHPGGAAIAEAWRSFSAPAMPFRWGTEFIHYLTGSFYLITGASVVAGFAIYATLGFLGSVLFCTAFLRAFPQADRRVFAVLIFLYPSLVFWTSDLGKDSLIFFALGIATFGYAMWLRVGPTVRSLATTMIGLCLVMLVRPHIAAATAIAMLIPGVGALLHHRVRNRATRIVVALLLATAGLLFVGISLRALGSEVSLDGIFQYIRVWSEGSSYGGSAFTPPDMTTPAGLLLAVPSVLLRPYPWEIHNIAALAAGVESLVLLGLLLWRRRSLVIPFRRPLDAYALFLVLEVVFTLLLLNTMGNIGLLVRQRTQLLPFLLMLICLGP